MTPERWERVGRIYHDALELESSERTAFLDRACGNDEELRSEVLSLLAAEKQVGEFIAEPAFVKATELLKSQNINPLAGQKLGGYEILSQLGKGGMGEVYLARDPRLERKIALKLLLVDFTRDENRVRRFIKEAKAVSALNHPNILTIHEIGEAEGRHYIATEYIEGRTLRNLMMSERIKPTLAINIVTQIANALNAAHTAGIIHRDIKPENIMLRPDGLVKVLDFGLAKLTEARGLNSDFDTLVTTGSQFRTEPGIILGTVAYMSPEQLRGQEIDSRTDIFSLGVLFYEMIAGRRPFTGETSNHVFVAILDHSPPPLSQFVPGVPGEFQDIIDRALRKNRNERYQNVCELLADLKPLAQRTEAASERALPEEMISTVIMDEDSTSGQLTQSSVIKSTGWTEAMATQTNLWRLINHLLSKKRRALAMISILIISAAAALFYFANRSPVLTDKDVVLLSDFNNLTGEEVFDNTLKQALSVQLEQSPFLSFFPEERIRETLLYMGHESDVRVTAELAREICQRQGVKAFLAGSIARFDRHYYITLEVINSQTGETIAHTLAEATDKDQVLKTLGRSATQLRERLGESLASIQKFDAPLEQATTSSLSAFKAWSRGLEMARRGKGAEAIPFYKHAKELDPNFAKADVSLSLAYSNLGQLELAAEYAASAFSLRERVTERERFDIASNYYALSIGDLLKAIETVELWKQTYPRDYNPPSRLSSLYRLTGQLEKALAAGREANQINPRAYVPYVSIGTALLQLNRFDEARNHIENALSQQMDTATSHRDLFQIAFIRNESALMNQQIEWAKNSRDAYWAHYWQALSASFAGQMRLAEELYSRAYSQAEPVYPERAEWFNEESLLRQAVCGLCQQVKTARRLRASALINLQSHIPASASRALALALCGETVRAESLALTIEESNEQSTLANAIWLPVVRAAVELHRGNYDQTVAILQPVQAYESAAHFWLAYLRGQAFLRRKSGEEARAEFQRILDNRGWDATSPLWPLAYLGLARAKLLAGDRIGSENANRAFAELWKQADPGLPILNEMKKTYSNSAGVL